MRQEGRAAGPARGRRLATSRAASKPVSKPASTPDATDGLRPDTDVPRWSPLIPVAVEAAVRGALAMLAGFAATAAVALLLWTITPTSTTGPEPQLKGAVAAYVLAHFGRIDIGTATLSLTPLLLTGLFALLLAAGPGRGRMTGVTVRGEILSIVIGALSYAVLVTVAAFTLGPDGSRHVDVGLWSFLLAAAALTLGMVLKGEALRELALTRMPGWVTAGLTAGGVAGAVLVGGAALAVAGSLVASFPTAAELNETVAGSVGDGIALTVVGVGYLPNLVMAGLGYVTGVGFTVGPGSYSPFGSVVGDLPPFPVLAAVPTTAGASAVGLVLLVVPVAAGLGAGLLLMRRLTDRRERMFAVLVAAAAAGVLIGVVVALGGGGISGGRWPQIGAAGWRVGLIAAGSVLVIAGVWVLAAGYSRDAATALMSARGKALDSADGTTVATDTDSGTGSAIDIDDEQAVTDEDQVDSDLGPDGADSDDVDTLEHVTADEQVAADESDLETTDLGADSDHGGTGEDVETGDSGDTADTADTTDTDDTDDTADTDHAATLTDPTNTDDAAADPTESASADARAAAPSAPAVQPGAPAAEPDAPAAEPTSDDTDRSTTPTAEDEPPAHRD